MINKTEFHYLLSELNANIERKKIPIEEIAKKCDVSIRTVYNFKSGVCFNINVFTYFLYEGMKTDLELYKMLLENCFE